MPELTKQTLGGLQKRKASEDEQRPCIILYGDGGIGKTTLAASTIEVPEMCPVIHLNIENGIQSAKEKYPDLEYLQVEDINQLQMIYKELHSTGGAGYKTCIVDNLTETQSAGIENFLKDDKQKGLDTDFISFESPSWGNGGYSHSSAQMRKIIRLFRGLPMNIIFTAWKRNYADAGKKDDWRPAFTKTFGGEAPGMVNDVYHYYMKDGKRILLTGITDTVVAKDRTGKLPQMIENPTMQIIHDYWTGKTIKPEPSTQTGPIKKQIRNR